MTTNIRFAAASAPRRAFAALSYAALLALGGCHKTSGADPDTAEPKTAGAATKGAAEAEEGVALTADQVQKMGIVAEPAKAADYTAETPGYGVIVAHETIAAAVAEWVSAQATQQQSQAALARSQRLAGTPGAMSADLAESASRQAATDSAAVALAKQRLTGIIGSGYPRGAADGDSVLEQLAGGRIKLLRATFPLGALHGAPPPSLRATHLDAVPSGALPEQGWKSHAVWDAPADTTLPGRSFFALLKGADAAEGERLLVWAPGAGPVLSGVKIPAAAVVIGNGKNWCYVEKKPGTYLRREVNAERPLADGYFVTEGVAAGDKVVTAAAGLLLARETSPGSDAE